MRFLAVIAMMIFVALETTCTTAQNGPSPQANELPSQGNESKPALEQNRLPLKLVADIPLSGNANRLDYQSFDASTGRLYIAHLADDMLTVFDVKTQKVV